MATAVLGAALLAPTMLLSAGAPAAVDAHGGLVQDLHHVHNVQESSNWSGYVETSSTSGAYSAITGEWIVPTADRSSGRSYEASWIGIDGDGNSDLIQTGTSTQYVDGHASYGAWWEILPAAETQIPSMTVSPGDRMSAAISHASGSQWQITITDLTTGQTFTTTQSYSGPGESAEWIVERPEVGFRLSNLNDYGTETFGYTTLNGGSPNLVPADEMDMTDSGSVISTPSAPSPGANDFKTAYGSKAPAPPR